MKPLEALLWINDSAEYRSFFIGSIKPRAIELPGADPDTAGAKEAICEIVKGIRFFYAMDRYGIEREFEDRTRRHWHRMKAFRELRRVRDRQPAHLANPPRVP